MEMTRSRVYGFLSILGGLLLVESFAAFAPVIKEYANSAFGAIVYFGGISLTACLGLSALILSGRPADSRTPVAILCLGSATAFVPALLPPEGTWVLTPDQFTWLFRETAFVLGIAGAPLLWGSALVRRERPEESEPWMLGRIGAGLVLLGFLITFVSQLTLFVPSSGFSIAVLVGHASAFDVLGHVLRLATRLIVLWGSVEGARTVRGPADGVIIAQRIRRLMMTWFLLQAAASVQDLISWQLGASEEEKHGYLARQTWQLTVLVTFVLTMVVLVTKRFPKIGDGYKAGATEHPGDHRDIQKA